MKGEWHEAKVDDWPAWYNGTKREDKQECGNAGGQRTPLAAGRSNHCGSADRHRCTFLSRKQQQQQQRQKKIGSQANDKWNQLIVLRVFPLASLHVTLRIVFGTLRCLDFLFSDQSDCVFRKFHFESSLVLWFIFRLNLWSHYFGPKRCLIEHSKIYRMVCVWIKSEQKWGRYWKNSNTPFRSWNWILLKLVSGTFKNGLKILNA